MAASTARVRVSATSLERCLETARSKRIFVDRSPLRSNGHAIGASDLPRYPSLPDAQRSIRSLRFFSPESLSQWAVNRQTFLNQLFRTSSQSRACRTGASITRPRKTCDRRLRAASLARFHFTGKCTPPRHRFYAVTGLKNLWAYGHRARPECQFCQRCRFSHLKRSCQRRGNSQSFFCESPIRHGRYWP